MSTADTINSLVTLLVVTLIPTCIYLALQARKNRQILVSENDDLRYRLERETQTAFIYRRLSGVYCDLTEESMRNGEVEEAEEVAKEGEGTDERDLFGVS